MGVSHRAGGEDRGTGGVRGDALGPVWVGTVVGAFPYAVGTAGNGACPAGAPFLGKKWGKEPPGEEVPPPGPPSLVGWCGGGCTSHLLPGLRPSQRKARNGPPTGWAGWGRRWVPFGKRRRMAFSVFLFLLPSINHFSRPPKLVGGPRGVGLRGRRPGRPTGNPRCFYNSPEKRGVGERNSFPRGGPGGKAPWCSFPYFFKEIGPRLGSQGSRPFQRCEKTLHPHPGRLPPQPPAQTKNTAVPHRLRRCFFSARRKRPPQSPISRSRFTISTALRAQS